MAKNTYLNANVNPETDSFGQLISKVNDIISDMGTSVVTVTNQPQPNTVNFGVTVGNAHIQGIFSSNTMVVSDTLRGGSTSSNGKLNVSGNVEFKTSNSFLISNTVISTIINSPNTQINSSGSLTVNAASSSFNSNTVVFSSNTVNVNSRSVFIGNSATDTLLVRSNTTFNSNVVLNSTLNVAGNSSFNNESHLVNSNNVVFSSNTVNVNSRSVFIGNSATDTLLVRSNTTISGDFIANGTNYATNSNTVVFSSNTVNVNSRSVFIGNSATDTLLVRSNTTFNAGVTLNSTLNVVGNSSFNNILHVINSNTVTINSNNMTIGNSNSVINVLGKINSTIIPNLNNTYDIGSNTNRYKDFYINNINSYGNVSVTGSLNTSTLISNGINDTGNASFNAVHFKNISNDSILFVTSNGVLGSNSGEISYNSLSGLRVNNQVNALGVNSNNVVSNNISINGFVDNRVLIYNNNKINSSGNFTFNGNTLNVIGSNSTNQTTGAIVVNGGVGISEKLNVGNNLVVGGDLYVTGNTYLSSNVALTLNTSTVGDLYITNSISFSVSNRVIGNIIPLSNTYNIGSDTNKYDNIYANNFNGNLNWSNISNIPSPTITLSGKVSGSATMTNLGSVNITTSVVEANSTTSGIIGTGNQTFSGVKTFTSTISGSINGNANTATRLQNITQINGVNFDGSTAVSIPSNINFVANTHANSQPLMFVLGTTANNSGNFSVGYSNGINFQPSTGTLTVIDLNSSSDKKYKTNIETLSNSTEKVLKLRGVEYDRTDTNKHYIGLIAQEVEEIIPEVVNEDHNGDKYVSYGNIVAVLIETIKELEERIKILENKS